jgi:hypothetical protein
MLADSADTEGKQNITETAQKMAKDFGDIFLANDQGLKQQATVHCQNVDKLLFPHLTLEEVELASSAYVDALWEKDNIELECLQDGELNQENIKKADYSQVRKHLRTRASAIGADQRYAIEKTKAWRNHKAGGDYWTPYQNAQVHELRAALQNPNYPNKPKYGQSGPGPEPIRYVLAAELHDMHSEKYHEQAIEVLVPYFARILMSHNDE